MQKYARLALGQLQLGSEIRQLSQFLSGIMLELKK
jgi:hypothetical protein